jgi:subtilisin family serine protease
MEPGDLKGGTKALESQAGISFQSVGGSEAATHEDRSIGEGQGIVFHELGVAIVNAPPDQLSAVSSAVAGAPSLHIMEPERFVFAIGGVDLTYLRGYRDAVNHLYEQVMAGTEGLEGPSSQAFDESSLAWGVQATNVGNSRYTGNGIKIAVLDTGLDQSHPDFTGKKVETRSFIDGQSVQDGNGHGTHCAGVCGPLRPQRTPRFGIAYESDIYIGKVLNDAGKGADANIIAGIQWALAAGCDIISMSLGAPVQPGTAYSPIFEQIAQRALSRGTIIVAAAGNDSNRSRGMVAQVSHPANCPSMMAIAAVDQRLNTAWFSNARSGTRAFDEKPESIVDSHDGTNQIQHPHWYKGV